MRSTTWGRWGGAGAAAALVVLASCSSPAASSAPAGDAAPSSAAAQNGYGAPARSASAGGADLGVATTSLGKVVVDREGRTAYYFDKDKAGSGSSTCAGECLAAWPAIAPSGSIPTVDGVSAKVGTIKRSDGSAQITLEGRPVYLFVKDTAAGQVTGQGVGGVWYVVAADGSEVKTAPKS